ncbi:MAG: CcmD family protein [Ignavibacteriaceae bacterium]|nr:CcmD family protein [Ignavibacteriaceae bacterium]
MEQFFADNAIYIVLVIVLIVWAGIYGYLYTLDKRLKSIETETKGVKK